MIDVLFIGDSYQSLDHENDTSLHLINYLHSIKKVKVYWASPQHIYLDNNLHYVQTQGTLNSKLEYSENKISIKLNDFHSIHWRKDPPVDIETYRTWNLLKSYPNNSKIINSINALSLWHEKFFNANYASWAISSFVSNDIGLIKNYITKNHSKKLIIKPAGSAGSRGIEVLPQSIEASIQIIQNKLTSFGDWIIIQEYENQVQKMGETRLFYIGGKIVGALNKKPRQNKEIMDWPKDPKDWPQLTVCSLSKIQKTRSTKICNDLKKAGVHFATIDFIGSKLLEINITSPGLLKWYDDTTNKNLASIYWKKLI